MVQNNMGRGIYVLILSLIGIFAYASAEDVPVQTSVGEIIGFTSKITKEGQEYDVTQFLGIPFAEPPTAERRFAKPVKKSAFSTPFMAKQRGNACPSILNPGIIEDCLNLNIFVPGRPPLTPSRAVMVWIHGGGFQFDSQDRYMAPGFAGMNDIIYVTMNYRLGPFGFLANRDHGMNGNYGLWDQHMAIQWIHDNIAAFGGDTNRVTVFGESAGAASVIYQCLYPGNKGLFQNAIAQSGTSSALWAKDETPEKEFIQLIAGSGCKGSFSDLEKCIREMNALSILIAAGRTMFYPTVDGEFVRVPMNVIFKTKGSLPDAILKRFGDINLIIGINENDGSSVITPEMGSGTSMAVIRAVLMQGLEDLGFPTKEVMFESVFHEYIDRTHINDTFAMANGLMKLTQDIAFVVTMAETASAHVDANGAGRCYMYEFAEEPTFGTGFYKFDWLRGAKHGDEIPFVLGMPNTLLHTNVSDSFTIITEDERQLSRRMMEMWARFAKTGSPNPVGNVEWPEYDSTSQQYIILKGNGTTLPIKQKIGQNAIFFWEKLLPMLAKTVQEAEACTGTSASGSLLPLATVYFLIPAFLCLL